MKKLILICAAIAGLSILASVQAQDSKALVDALVKKGVLTSKEGEEIQCELNKEWATSPANKLRLADHIQQLKLYGETRLRYQYDEQGRNTFNENQQFQDRMRVKIKLFADYQFTENLSAGLGLMSGTANASNSATFDNAFSPAAVSWSRAWLKWSKAFDQDWLEFVLGKQALGQKFSGYDISSDVNPEGFLMKLGKFDIDKEWSIWSTHAIYYYDDTREDNFTKTAGEGDDTLMIVNQVTLAYAPNKDWKWEVTPGFVYYSGSDPAVVPAGKTTTAAAVSPEDLAVLMVNMGMWHPIDGRVQGNLYGEYGVNLNGASRGDALNPGAAARDGDNQFFMAGYTVGNDMKKKGDWQVGCDYAYYETFSWDSNIMDTNFNNYLLNGHGYNFKAGYNFTDFVNLTAYWRQSWMIDNGAPSINGLTRDTNTGAGNLTSRTDCFYMDLTWKF